jgi:hypothetical protein
MYDSSRDPPSAPEYNAWSVLATTEKWISQTLAAAETPDGNPYSRKEVSYDCDVANDAALLTAGVWRRLKEARQIGEEHGTQEVERKEQQGDDYEPRKLRLTSVVVLPANPGISESFAVFDNLLQQINQARRQSRDYVTDLSLEQLDERMHADEDAEEEWSISVNCAHLHPNFGEQTPEQVLEDLKDDEEIDVHYEEYKRKRLEARQSPYPTVVIEVRAMPPPPELVAPPKVSRSRAAKNQNAISAMDVQRLEALFGKTAHMNHPSSQRSGSEDSFYDALGSSLEEIHVVTPMKLAQQWIATHDPNLPKTSPVDLAAFTESKTSHVDEAYEFVFANIAMLRSQPQSRQYLVLPCFLSSAATSLQKFATQVETMVNIWPDLQHKVQVEMFHPEHVDSSRRSPVPILSLQWKERP